MVVCASAIKLQTHGERSNQKAPARSATHPKLNLSACSTEALLKARSCLQASALLSAKDAHGLMIRLGLRMATNCHRTQTKLLNKSSRVLQLLTEAPLANRNVMTRSRDQPPCGDQLASSGWTDDVYAMLILFVSMHGITPSRSNHKRRVQGLLKLSEKECASCSKGKCKGNWVVQAPLRCRLNREPRTLRESRRKAVN